MNGFDGLYDYLKSLADNYDYIILFNFVICRFDKLCRGEQVTCLKFFKDLYYSLLNKLLESGGTVPKIDPRDIEYIGRLHNIMYSQLYDS